VPRFEPFRGVRYDPDRVDLAQVTAPPYDVIDAAGRQALAARHPDNVVAIDLPTDGGDDDSDGFDAYDHARRLLEQWLAEGILRRDPPSFYVYRMTREGAGGTRHTTGVMGALELSRPGEGDILPHERTTPKAKSDRLHLLEATQANLSPVWGLSPAAGLSALVDLPEAPTATWDDDGVTHSLWVVDDPERIEAIAAAVGAHPVVIADGHHRYETSVTYRDAQRRDHPGDTPGAEAVLAYVVELVDDELDVAPIHRLVSGLPPDLDLVGALEPFFEVGASEVAGSDVAARLAEAGALGLVTTDGVRPLVPRPEVFAEVRDLDTSRLDLALAALPAHELVFQHGVDQVRAEVAAGRAQAGFLLRPATVAQIVEIAHGGERMPPKTTFFAPKPCTGVVLRLLDE